MGHSRHIIPKVHTERSVRFDTAFDRDAANTSLENVDLSDIGVQDIGRGNATKPLGL